jgi:nucleotide-binding universal stress UspA family protein
MYKKILIPLDGSSAAEIVLPYAEEIAAKLSSEITVVTISHRHGQHRLVGPGAVTAGQHHP